jgi:hypothetical protein
MMELEGGESRDSFLFRDRASRSVVGLADLEDRSPFDLEGEAK